MPSTGHAARAGFDEYVVLHLLRTGIADHLKIRSLQMSVLTIILFYAGIVGYVLGIFFQVVRGRV